MKKTYVQSGIDKAAYNNALIHHYGMIHNDFMLEPISTTAKVVYVYLVTRDKAWQGGRNRIAEELQMDERTVTRAVSELETEGYLCHESAVGFSWNIEILPYQPRGLQGAQKMNQLKKGASSFDAAEDTFNAVETALNAKRTALNAVGGGPNPSDLQGENFAKKEELRSKNALSELQGDRQPLEDDNLAQDSITPPPPASRGEERAEKAPVRAPEGVRSPQTATGGPEPRKGPGVKAVFLAWCAGEDPLSKLKNERKDGLADILATLKANGVPKESASPGVIAALFFGDKNSPKIREWKAAVVRDLELIHAEEYADDGIILARGKTKQDREEEWYLEYANSNFRELTPELIAARKKQREQEDAEDSI